MHAMSIISAYFIIIKISYTKFREILSKIYRFRFNELHAEKLSEFCALIFVKFHSIKSKI